MTVIGLFETSVGPMLVGDNEIAVHSASIPPAI